MINFCVSLTTLPSRINNIKDTLDSIISQTITPNKIFLNLPHEYKRFPNYKFTDEQINKISNYNLEITRCEDYGPATKLMGSINKIKKKYECIILVDDDHIYHKRMFEIFINNFCKEKINYSFYLNKIFNIRNGQCSDGFLINIKLLDEIENFYNKYVKNNKNMFLDDDLWFAIYLYCEKKSYTKNIIQDFRNKTGEHLTYHQNINKDIDALHQTVHRNTKLLNRRKIQKLEFIKYKLRKLIKF